MFEIRSLLTHTFIISKIKIDAQTGPGNATESIDSGRPPAWPSENYRRMLIQAGCIEKNGYGQLKRTNLFVSEYIYMIAFVNQTIA